MKPLHLPFTDAVLLLSSRWREMSYGAIFALAFFAVLVPTAVLLLYRYEMRLVKPLTATGLLVLRLVTVLFVLFVLIFQPVFERSKSEEVQARVMIAIDRSNSVKVADPQRSEVEKLRLARALKFRGEATEKELDDWIAQYEQNGRVEWVGRDEFLNEPVRRQQMAAEQRARQGLRDHRQPDPRRHHAAAPFGRRPDLRAWGEAQDRDRWLSQEVWDAAEQPGSCSNAALVSPTAGPKKDEPAPGIPARRRHERRSTAVSRRWRSGDADSKSGRGAHHGRPAHGARREESRRDRRPHAPRIPRVGEEGRRRET